MEIPGGLCPLGSGLCLFYGCDGHPHSQQGPSSLGECCASLHYGALVASPSLLSWVAVHEGSFLRP